MRRGAIGLTLLALAGGLIGGALLVYGVMGEAVASRERSLAKWRDLARDDREALQSARDMELAGARAWRAALAEMDVEYGRIRELLHERELRLASASDRTVWLGAAVLALALGAIVFIARDANAACAEAVRNAVALAPPEMLRSFFAVYFDIGRIVLPDQPERPKGGKRPSGRWLGDPNRALGTARRERRRKRGRIERKE